MNYMNKVPQRDPIRDKKLIAKYLKKNSKGEWEFTTTQVAADFNMSTSRLYQVLNYYNIPRRSEDDRHISSEKNQV